ncbi:MAG: hypothetical protein ABSA21_05625 [Candidatus Limnocylindrales bacterium]
MRIPKLGIVLLIAWAVVGCVAAGATASSLTPSPDPIGLGFVDQTNLEVSLVVNGTVVETFAPHSADDAIHMSALPSLPWVVEARTASGRVLLTMTAGPGDVQTQPGNGAMSYGKEAGAELSCGQLYLWTGTSEPIWPAPGSGSPGDCAP